jgi:ectoine hydroxylase-related dioxygenase (phytanoyl-CoA dioxygenase family)
MPLHCNSLNDPQIKSKLEAFKSHGVVTLENYLGCDQADAVLKEIEIVTARAEQELKLSWGNQAISFHSTNKENATRVENDFAHEAYFVASRDRSHVFYEAYDDVRQINRVGHALHKESSQPNLTNLINHQLLDFLKALAYVRPVCHLSVYIPKYGKGVGSKVRPHQENTFAYTCPTSALVLWIALEDACVDNACLWGILGSHRWPLKYISKLDRSANSRTFHQVSDIEIPDFDLQREYYTPLTVKKGDALIMHGNFVHASPVNHSDRSRKCLSLQFIETKNTNYPDFNWIWPRRNDFLYGE